MHCLDKVALLWVKVSLRNYLQGTPVWLVKGYIPEGAETVIRLGIKFWFTDVGP